MLLLIFDDDDDDDNDDDDENADVVKNCMYIIIKVYNNCDSNSSESYDNNWINNYNNENIKVTWITESYCSQNNSRPRTWP